MSTEQPSASSPQPPSGKLTKTRYTGIYQRGSRYVVPYRHRGRPHRPSFRTLKEAREFKGKVSSGAPTPTTRQTVERYAAEWLPAYSGRTASGLTERSRAAYSMLLDNTPCPGSVPNGKWLR
jgi:hypothetical protein